MSHRREKLFAIAAAQFLGALRQWQAGTRPPQGR